LRGKEGAGDESAETTTCLLALQGLTLAYLKLGQPHLAAASERQALDLLPRHPASTTPHSTDYQAAAASVVEKGSGCVGGGEREEIAAGETLPDPGEVRWRMSKIVRRRLAEAQAVIPVICRGLLPHAATAAPDSTHSIQAPASLAGGELADAVIGGKKGGGAKCVTLLQEALDIAMQVEDVVLEAVVCSQLGAAYDECLGDLARALDYQKVAVHILGSQGPEVADDEAVALVRMGSILRRQGLIKPSVSTYSRALKLLRELLGGGAGGGGGGKGRGENAKRSRVELLAKTLNNLGEALMALGRLDVALLRLGEAHAIKSRLYGPVHLDVAATLENLGLVHSTLGNLDDALGCARGALDIRTRILGRVHKESAKSMLNLAAVMLRLSDKEGALRMWRDSVSVFVELREISLDVAKAYNNMATIEEERGNDLEALALHKKALEIKLSEAPQSLTVADSLYNMAILYEKAQRYPEAIEACQRSLALAVECGGKEHPSAVEARDFLRELKAGCTL
jgi:tetratricopeptide (TPR) repeat protein